MPKLRWTPKQLQIAAALQEGTMTQKEIAQKLGVNKNSVTKVAKALKPAKRKRGQVLPATAPLKTTNIAEATTIVFKPRVYEMEAPAIIWQAMEAAIKVWGWPPDMTPEQFVDAFLRLSFAQRGIYLGSYVVVKPSEEHEEKT